MMATKVVIGHLCLGMKLCLGRHPRGVSPSFPLQWGRTPPTLEVFLLESPKSQCRFLPWHLQNKELPQGIFSTDILCGTKLWPLLRWFPGLAVPGQEPLSGDPFLVMAASGPGGFCSHSLFAQQPLLSYRYGEWNPPGSHQGSSSKNRFMSNLCSAS